MGVFCDVESCCKLATTTNLREVEKNSLGKPIYSEFSLCDKHQKEFERGKITFKGKYVIH